MIPVPSSTVRRTGAAIVVAAGFLVAAPLAHKTVVSPYTFHRDVAPILREHCGSCHVEGGNAFPLSTYEQAKGRAWPIQQALMSGRMPVWFADSQSTPFKASRAISAKQLDILSTWAAGSTPEGLPVADPPGLVVAPPTTPFAVLEMPEPFTMAASQREAVREITWPAGRLAGRWVQAADLLPGTPSIVRRASIVIRSGDGDDQVVSLWIPGDTPQALPGGGAFKVPRRAAIVLRIVYQRPASEPRAIITDRSRVALFVLPSNQAKPVREVRIVGEGQWRYYEKETFTQRIDARAQIAAIRPLGGPIDGRVALTLIAPDGRRSPLATLVIRPEWPRRYVFAESIPVEKGSRIEAVVTPSYGVSLSSLTGDRSVGPLEGGSLRMLLETLRP